MPPLIKQRLKVRPVIQVLILFDSGEDDEELIITRALYCTHPAHQNWVGSGVLLNDEELIPDPSSLGPVEHLAFLPRPLSVSVQRQVTYKCKHQYIYLTRCFWSLCAQVKFFEAKFNSLNEGISLSLQLQFSL